MATIELGKEDGNLVTALSVKLMDGVESLYNKIGRPRNWRGRGVIDVLSKMQSSILSLDNRFDGNWVSVFVRLELKGKKQMLVNTETRKVSVCIVFQFVQCIRQTNDF